MVPLGSPYIGELGPAYNDILCYGNFFRQSDWILKNVYDWPLVFNLILSCLACEPVQHQTLCDATGYNFLQLAAASQIQAGQIVNNLAPSP